jgi:anti-sigma28 factor (negative regulator of flagellin synthesis)
MPAKKRSASASKKRGASSTKKKAVRAKAAAIKADLKIPKLELSMPLDARKVAAIKRCLDKGKLTITVSRVDLVAGRAGDGYLYD